MEASVVICAYTMDRWVILTQSIGSVLQQSVRPKEVILVIDHNDELRLRVESEFGESVMVIPNVNGRGLSGGRQTGAERTTGDVIVFLDDDAVAEPDWLKNLLAGYDDPRVLGVGGAIEPLWEHEPAWFPDEFRWVIGCTYAGMPVGEGNIIRNPIGANMSVRADVFARLGGFAAELGRREGVPTVLGVVGESCEETEFAIRASRHFPGGVWRYRGDACVHHLVPVQRSTWRFFVDRCRREGRAKAILTNLAGARESLGSERKYALRLGGAVLHGVLHGQIRRAAAIIAGLAVTTVSYAHARRAARRNIASQKALGHNHPG